ncbi:hypothetical protein ACFFRR_008609 [Megaselia abdita]
MEINNGARNGPMNNRNTQISNENNNASSNAISPANDRIDAIHHRFRQNRESNQQIVCLSCKREFVASSQADIYSHYSEQEHLEYFSLCLYCQGKVHRYSEGNRVELYHNCSRWKRNLDN